MARPPSPGEQLFWAAEPHEIDPFNGLGLLGFPEEPLSVDAPGFHPPIDASDDRMASDHTHNDRLHNGRMEEDARMSTDPGQIARQLAVSVLPVPRTPAGAPSINELLVSLSAQRDADREEVQRIRDELAVTRAQVGRLERKVRELEAERAGNGKWTVDRDEESENPTEDPEKHEFATREALSASEFEKSPWIEEASAISSSAPLRPEHVAIKPSYDPNSPRPQFDVDYPNDAVDKLRNWILQNRWVPSTMIGSMFQKVVYYTHRLSTHSSNPLPSKSQSSSLARETGLTVHQITRWIRQHAPQVLSLHPVPTIALPTIQTEEKEKEGKKRKKTKTSPLVPSPLRESVVYERGSEGTEFEAEGSKSKKPRGF